MSNQFKAPPPPVPLTKVLVLPGVSLVSKGLIKAFDEAKKKEDGLQEKITPLSPTAVRRRRKEILAAIAENPTLENKARKELHELDRASEVRKVLKENARKIDTPICLPLAVEILEGALAHLRPSADLFIEEERERYAAFGLEHLDSPLALGIEETVKRQENNLESLKRRLGGTRGSSGASLGMVGDIVEF
jgi:hypothetical protein